MLGFLDVLSGSQDGSKVREFVGFSTLLNRYR